MLTSIVKIKPAGHRGPSSPVQPRRRASLKSKDSLAITAAANTIALKKSRDEKMIQLVSLHISIAIAGEFIQFFEIWNEKFP